ncbi:DUF3291 domain-containing protein [Chloroflexi bacterium TSY]|nr:DUF3291 domain-containing protein [Chloroflexi bacterium TSY]
MSRLAFYTFGILRHPNEMTTEFGQLQHQIPLVFDDAIHTPGYIEPILDTKKLKIRPRFFNRTKHFDALVTFSIWQDLESVFAFTYQGRHNQALRQRHDWLIKGDWPGYVAWWIADDYVPSFGEGAARLEYLHDRGPSPYGFTFRQAYRADGRLVVGD